MIIKDDLMHMVKRIRMDEEFLVKYPENKDIIQKHMDRQKDGIVQCVLRNEGNPLLERLWM